MARIEIKNLRKQFNAESVAVDQLDLDIADGEFVALLGPSGCGKTTTLRMLAGLELPTSGEIVVGDRVVNSNEQMAYVPPQKRGMGLVFQNYALWPHLTVERNVSFGLEMEGVGKRERRSRVDEVLDLLQIRNQAEKYPAQLSGGQQQRVALARMLVVNPDVLLLDEPLSNLDAALRLEMRAELKRLHAATGSTVVFVTHDQFEAMTMATRIAVMHAGVLQQYAPPEAVYQRPVNLFVAQFVGSPPMNVARTAEASGAPEGTDDAETDAHAEGAGLVAALTDPAFGGPAVADTQVTAVGVRPEDVNVRAGAAPSAVVAEGESGPEWCTSADVLAILPTGPTWIVQLRAAGMELYAVTARPPRFTAGETVTLGIPRDRVHYFDGDGNRVAAADRREQGVVA